MLLFYIKYTSNNLSLQNFSFEKTGNFLSMTQFVFYLIVCILIFFDKKRDYSSHLKILLFLSIIAIIPLVVIFFIYKLNFIFSNDYLLGYPVKKIVPLILFIINQSVFIFILFMLFYLYLDFKLLAYLYSLLSFIAVVVFYILFAFILTFLIDDSDVYIGGEKFDYGIILGAAVWSGDKPSPIFTNRIDKGAELFLKNLISKIHLTGGNAPGELSEAKAAYNYLVSKYFIDESKILIEEETSTTNEQIKYFKINFNQKNPKPKLLFISDNFHLRRISEMSDFYNLNAKVVASGYNLNLRKSLYYRLRDSIGLVLFWFFAI
jgi:vancomycin permeability regulator SanA